MLQASEGGSISVGNRKFKVRAERDAAAASTPPSSASLEGIPIAMPNAKLRTDRISRISPLRLSMLAPATDKMVVSKSALIGFCLTSFAAGIAMTLTVDRVHARAAEAPREPEPIVLKTTPLEAAAPAVAPPAALAPPPAVPAPVAAPAAPAPAPAVHAPALPAAPAPAAAEAVVVQLPPSEPEKKVAAKPAVPILAPAAHPARKIATVTAAATPLPAPAPPAARKVAAATPPAHAVAPRKPAHATESSPTEAAPDEDPMLPTATKKKWADPFDP